jgi:hypothetical protein
MMMTIPVITPGNTEFFQDHPSTNLNKSIGEANNAQPIQITAPKEAKAKK